MSRPMLAATGILFLLVVAAVTAYLVFRFVKSGRFSGKPLPAEPAEDRFASLRRRYDGLFVEHGVPYNAMLVGLACNNYTPDITISKHYCWLKDNVMVLFPTWESVAGTGPSPVEDIRPREWRIPVENIVCFAMEQGLPDKFVVLQFKKEAGVVTLAFSEDAARVFALLFPEKDFSHLLEELYPKSSRNIRDIKENFLSLKELREEDLITEDEYAAKKKEMLILM